MEQTLSHLQALTPSWPCCAKPAYLGVCIQAAIMHVWVCEDCLRTCASFCVCMHMHVCVWWLPNEESRKRKRRDGWRGCLFIHYSVALVVSGGHGNTCPGPFSAGLFVACFGSIKAFSARSLFSQLWYLLFCLFVKFFNVLHNPLYKDLTFHFLCNFDRRAYRMFIAVCHLQNIIFFFQ